MENWKKILKDAGGRMDSLSPEARNAKNLENLKSTLELDMASLGLLATLTDAKDTLWKSGIIEKISEIKKHTTEHSRAISGTTSQTVHNELYYGYKLSNSASQKRDLSLLFIVDLSRLYSFDTDIPMNAWPEKKPFRNLHMNGAIPEESLTLVGPLDSHDSVKKLKMKTFIAKDAKAREFL